MANKEEHGVVKISAKTGWLQSNWWCH